MARSPGHREHSAAGGARDLSLLIRYLAAEAGSKAVP